jgi:Transcription factor WhiB
MAKPTKIAAARASERLTQALIDARAQGLRHHCDDASIAYLWLSEHEHERALAARLCVGCPVQMECWSVARARREKFGVWGSVDFTPKRGRPKQTAS